MTKLNQIIALEKGVNSRTENLITAVYHNLQKAEPMAGIARSYRPKDAEGDTLPSESTRVQFSAEQLLKDAAKAWESQLDITATKDYANAVAKADVVVDSVVLVKDAPVPFLIFLEKKLDVVREALRKVPVLPAAEQWEFDTNQACYATKPTESIRTKKVPKVQVLYEATDKHPAQVQAYNEDVLVGYWTTIKYSGAMTQTRLNELQARLAKLQDAVKVAREAANNTDVTDVKVGDAIFAWLLA